MPFISGKDSSSGTFRSDGRTIDVPLTLVVATLARVPDVTRVVRKEARAAGDRLVLLGDLDPGALGGSVYLDTLGTRGDHLHDPGADGAARYLETWRRLHGLYQSPDSPVRAAAAIGEGGLLLRAFEMAVGGGLGVAVILDTLARSTEERWDGLLFAEASGAILVEVDASADPATLFAGLPWREVGRVTSDRSITVGRRGPRQEERVTLPLSDLTRAWESTFAEVIG